MVDRDRKIVQSNKKFCELWHLPREFVVLYHDVRLLNLAAEQIKDPVAFRQQVEAIYKTPECESFDVLEFKDGRTFERYSCPQYLGDQIVGRVWSFRDVTDRTLALKDPGAQRTQIPLACRGNGRNRLDDRCRTDGVVEDSPSWRRFTGQSYAEVKDNGWLAVVHPRDRERVSEIWQHAVRTGEVYEVEFRVRRADSEWRDVSARGVPVREGDGTIREWVGYCVDVTERKLANETIVKERDFSDGLISSLPGIFYLLDESGLNLRWNENLEKISGYSSQEISKMRATDFVPPEEKELVAERVHKVFVNGEADVELN